MKKAKDVGKFIVMILFFGFLTGVMLHEYVIDYNFFSFIKEEVTVEAKVSDNSLFRPPTYHVRIETEDGEQPNHLRRVSKWHFNKLDKGDTMDIYTTYGDKYFTVSDFIHEGKYYLFAIGVFGVLTLAGVFSFIMEIPGLYSGLYRIVTGHERKKKKKRKQGLGVLYAVLIIFGFFAGRFLFNLFNKLNPFMKETTEARIIDVYRDTTYRKYEDSEYSFTMTFADADGNQIETVKEVTNHTIGNYSVGDVLPITYSKLNPYNVFVDTWKISDIVGAAFYLESMMYIVFIVIILISWKAIRKWKRKA